MYFFLYKMMYWILNITLKPPELPLWITVQHQYLISVFHLWATCVILNIAKGEGYTESRQLLCLLFFCLAFDLQAKWWLLPLETANLCFEKKKKESETEIVWWTHLRPLQCPSSKLVINVNNSCAVLKESNVQAIWEFDSLLQTGIDHGVYGRGLALPIQLRKIHTEADQH